MLPQLANDIAAIATNMNTNFFISVFFLVKQSIAFKTDAKVRTFTNMVYIFLPLFYNIFSYKLLFYCYSAIYQAKYFFLF